MARSDWYGGIKWVASPADAEVVTRMVLEAGEASDRMREADRAAPKPAVRKWTDAERSLWNVLRATLPADEARRAFLRAISGEGR